MRSARAWLPAIVWAIAILLFSNDPLSAAHTGHPIRVIAEFFAGPLTDAQFEVVHFAVRKLAHLTEYGILAALIWRADKRWYVPLACALVLASLDEWHQSFVASRTGSPVDVGIDVVGASVGRVVVGVVGRIRRR
ncbi:MAG TPA: VanZ family protein [Thermoanaerobaculia bacterium]|nr:VanZ family protein [Thermoanaerobaculia bacterium]